LRDTAFGKLYDAARTYFDGYCQDEANSEPGCAWAVCEPAQYAAAVALRDALAEQQP
jgi:hypothetical protein